MPTLDDMPGYSASGVRAAPIKRMGTAVFILDMGTDGDGMPQELRIVVDPAVLDRHRGAKIGDFYCTSPNGAVVVERDVFTALFSAEQIETAGQQPVPETGPVPDDALGVTTQSLEQAQGVANLPAGGGVETEAQPQPTSPEPGLTPSDGLAPEDARKADTPDNAEPPEGEPEGNPDPADAGEGEPKPAA